jgi:phosphoglycolate phosphatase
MYKLVIFDMDGTTVETIDGIANSGNIIFGSYGYPPLPASFYKQSIGNGAKKLLELVMNEYKMDISKTDEVIAKFMQHYSENWDYQITLYDGVKKMIATLLENGIICTINTNKPQNIAAKIVDLFFKNDEISIFIGQQEKYRRKPDPQAVDIIIDQFGIDKADTIYVGDGDVDVNTAKNAGIKCIGVPWGYGQLEEVKKADYFANSMEELTAIILGSN